MKVPNNIKKQQGISLIELMIAMTLGLLLIGGVIQIFLSAQQSYRLQSGLSRMQENGRFAMEFLARDIRKGDYWGCVQSIDIENKLNPSPGFDLFTSGIAGQDNDATDANIVDGTDSITLRGIANDRIPVLAQPATTAANIDVINNSGLLANDVVIISNCIAADLFQVTNVVGGAGADNIIHTTGGTPQPGDANYPGNKSANLEAAPEPVGAAQPQANKYDSNAHIVKVSFISYQIRLDVNNQPSLFKSTDGGDFQSFIEGVENMQILYGEDTDADNTPNYYVPAGAVGLNMDQVVSIRISLLFASDDNISSQARAYTYNGTVTTPADRRIRRVFSSTIALRNRLP